MVRMREAKPGQFGDVVAQHRNSEGELATIERARAAGFEGRFLLCFYDEDSPVVAPMLLDAETVDWLTVELGEVRDGAYADQGQVRTGSV